jgi:hypothetical protein
LTTRPEIVLFSSLTDVDRLEYYAREGINTDIVPTVAMRQVVEWALKYYFESGCKQAPTREALTLEWGEVLEVEEIVLDDPDDEIETAEWSLGYLRSQYLHFEWQRWIKTAAAEMANSYTDDRVEVFSKHASELGAMLGTIRSHSSEAVGTTALADAMRRYREREAQDGAAHGLMLGLEHLDAHTFGIHDGELAVMAAGPKAGKSWLLANAVLTEWLRGRRGMLFTLENSVEMTVDRIVCLHAMVDYRSWQRGECTDQQMAQVEASRRHLEEMVGDMIVVMPPRGQRTVDAMLREAQMRGADSVSIDQLTFVEAAAHKGKARYEVVRDIMHDLKTGISTGSYKLPCLLAHQINREGVKAADKTGHLEMYMLAESSEVERTADWVFGLYRSHDDRIAEIAKLQVLASRREDVNQWLLAYNPAQGLIRTVREYTLESEG